MRQLGTSKNLLRAPIAALGGVGSLAYLTDMWLRRNSPWKDIFHGSFSRSLRSVRLALGPLATVIRGAQLGAIALIALLSPQVQADTPPTYPRLEYRSVLAGYLPYRERELIDWRAANELVERLGGHMGHAQAPGEQEPPGHGGHDASHRPAGHAGGRP